MRKWRWAAAMLTIVLSCPVLAFAQEASSGQTFLWVSVAQDAPRPPSEDDQLRREVLVSSHPRSELARTDDRQHAPLWLMLAGIVAFACARIASKVEVSIDARGASARCERFAQVAQLVRAVGTLERGIGAFIEPLGMAQERELPPNEDHGRKED